MKKNYRIKKTISMKQFISEFGENFSEHMKKKLLELEIRCVLTRKEDINKLDIKHVEHTQHDSECGSEDDLKNCHSEYAFGQLIVIDGVLYFSQECLETDEVSQAPIVSTIYNTLSSEDMILDSDSYAKKIDESNIDYVIDTILTVCPQVSQSYIDIISKYTKIDMSSLRKK